MSEQMPSGRASASPGPNPPDPEAFKRARGTLAENRGVGDGPGPLIPWVYHGEVIDPRPKPIHRPTRLDALKRLLVPPPSPDDQQRRTLDALKAIDDQRRRSDPGRPNPPGTVLPSLPRIPTHFLDGE